MQNLKLTSNGRSQFDRKYYPFAGIRSYVRLDGTWFLCVGGQQVKRMETEASNELNILCSK